MAHPHMPIPAASGPSQAIAVTPNLQPLPEESIEALIMQEPVNVTRAVSKDDQEGLMKATATFAEKVNEQILVRKD